MSTAERVQRRLDVLSGHIRYQSAHSLKAERCSSGESRDEKQSVQRAYPQRRQEVLKWNGWGYKDSKFYLNKDGVIEFTGKRYKIGGHSLPKLREFAEKRVGMDVQYHTPSQELSDMPIPMAVVNEKFVCTVKEIVGESHVSDSVEDRVQHAHGHACHEVYALRHGQFKRIPDLIVWPENHNQVVKIVEAASFHNVCLIPFGGGTNVSGAVECPPDEKRMIVSVDMIEMDKILWIDEQNLTMCAQAGIIGDDLERQLKARGYCTGHDPDSREISSLGGWISTRASGMKKNTYGNIEDLLVGVKMVTPRGVIERACQVPRISSGPDIHHFIMGSEGTLGIITEATLKMRPLPEVKRYGSLVFPDFESGVGCMREVARQHCAPASIRLVDNEQFQFSQVLKPSPSFFTSIKDRLKTFYVTKFKRFDPEKLCVATLVFEGAREDVASQEYRVYSIAAKFGGLPAGEENGERGYMLTMSIAYLRDIGLEYSVLAESFETSVPWDRVVDTCRNVKDRIQHESQRYQLIHLPFVSYRVTQTYDAGACIYFYMLFNYHGLSDPVRVHQELEHAAREEILSSGGSISHHHGVGKVRKQWLSETVSEPAVEMLRAIKQQTDPQNIFGSNNLISHISDEY